MPDNELKNNNWFIKGRERVRHFLYKFIPLGNCVVNYSKYLFIEVFELINEKE